MNQPQKDTHTSHRAYTGLADYAAQQGAPESAFIAAGWQAARYQNRPALLFATATGRRVRFIDGHEPRYTSPPGYQRCWYGLERAVEIAAATGQPLIIVNGEAGTVAAQYHGLAACCVTSGEKGSLPGNLLADLQAVYSGAIRVAFDCDDTGKKAGAGLAGQFTAAGFDAVALDLSLPNAGGDMADFCKANGDRAGELLAGLPVIESLPVVIFQRESQPRQSVAADDQRAAAYAAAAIDRALAELAATTTDRNNTGFRLGCVVYSFVLGGWPGVDRGWVESRLEEALQSTGLPMPEIRGLLASIRKRAEARPLELPDSPRPRRAVAPPLAERVQPVDLPAFSPDYHVNRRYFSEMDPLDIEAHLPHGFAGRGGLLVKSPIGTGKTEWLNRLFATLETRLGRFPSVLVITHRQALGRHMARRLGLVWHRDLPGEGGIHATSAPQLAITYDSCWRVAGGDYDLVVIDELAQVHPHTEAATMRRGEHRRNYAALKGLAENARLFVGLDAHLTDVALEWTRQMRADVLAVENTYRLDRGAMTVYANPDALLARAFDLLRAGKRVALPTSSKGESQILYHLLAGAFGAANGLLINSDNSESPEIQTFLEQPNARAAELRFLVYSPSLGTGFSVETPFDAVLGVFYHQPLAPADMLQMMGRCRNVSERGAYIQWSNGTLPTDLESLFRPDLNAAYQTAQQTGFADRGLTVKDPVLLAVHRLNAHYRAQRHAAMNQPVPYFVALAQSEGYTVNYHDGDNPALHDLRKAARQQLQAEWERLVLTSPPVNHEDYQRARQSGQASQALEAGYERFKIEDTVGLTIDERLYHHLKSGAKRARLRRFADLWDNLDDLAAADRTEAAEGFLYANRQHRVARRRLLEAACQLIFGCTPDQLPEVVRDIRQDDLTQRAEGLRDLFLPQLVSLLGYRPNHHSDQPLPVLRFILRHFGIQLAQRRIRVGEGLMYAYSLDLAQWETWRGYAVARLAHLAERRAVVPNPVNKQESGFGTRHNPGQKGRSATREPPRSPPDSRDSARLT